MNTKLSFTDLWTEAIFNFSLVQVIDGGSRAFTVLWLDHVARTHEPDCSDNSDEKCTIHSLVDGGLTEI